MAEDENVPAPEVVALPSSKDEDVSHADEVVRWADGIEYRQIAFDSIIPTFVAQKPGSNVDIPPCPDLNCYQSPYQWSSARKNLMTYLACSVNGVAAYASGSYASPEDQLREKWGVSHAVFTLGLTVFTIGFGVAPMILAPFSEINGRRPVFVLTGILFVAMQAACALTPTFSGMLVCRFLMGVGGCEYPKLLLR
jgi:hypothetical protein